MTADHHDPASPDLELARRLRLLRRKAGLSGHALAAEVGITQASVSRMETGNQRPTAQVVDDWTKVTKAPKTERTEILQLLDEVLAGYTSNRLRHADGLAAHQHNVLQREAQAKLIRVAQPAVVPGLLQTASYARSLFSIGPATLSPEEIEASVSARQERQGRLFDDTRQFEFLIFEQALWATFGPKETTVEQLRHLVRLAEFPNIWIGIVPLGTSLPMVPITAFVTYDEDLVTVETLTGAMHVQKEDEVAMYHQCFEAFTELAVSGDEFSPWIDKLIRRYARLSA